MGELLEVTAGSLNYSTSYLEVSAVAKQFWDYDNDNSFDRNNGKFRTFYSYGGTGITTPYQKNYTESRLGEAIWETSSIENKDINSWEGKASFPYIYLGDYLYFTARGNLLRFSAWDGSNNNRVTFRVALI